MYNRVLTSALAALLALVALSGCRKAETDSTVRGVYYWSTTFAMDSTKQQFIDRHNVGRMYVRYFDVVPNAYGQTVPNGTIVLDSTAHCDCEVIPTVYILNECMKRPQPDLPQKILDRVLQMSETHSMGPVKEIQIDCDWTQSTRSTFYGFLGEMHRLCKDRGVTLSATIRLHQLTQEVPPVDKGVLMVYNTGDVTNPDVQKPILDIKAVKPYLRYLKDYKLPLAAAYPIYKWTVVFRNRQFVDFLHHEDEFPVLNTDSILERMATADDILECKAAIESERPDCRQEIILFDFKTYNIKRYTDEDFESFYR